MGVHYLDLFHVDGVAEEPHRHMLEHHVLQVHLQEFIGRDIRDELGIGVYERVLRIEPIYVLPEDAVLCAHDLGHQERAGIRPVRRDAPEFRRVLVEAVGRGALDDRQHPERYERGEV